MARGLSIFATARPVIALLACLCALPVAAAAQALRDPTRPPFSGGAAPAGTPVLHGWVLQSVLISKERRHAVINGQLVSLGESVSGAELVAIAENRVTLRTTEGIRTVHLFPEVAKRGTAAHGETTPGRQQETKPTESGTSGMEK